MACIRGSYTPVDERVEELLITQYQDAPNLKAYIKAFTKPIESIVYACCDSVSSRSIDKATGYSLDKIGKVVGEKRVMVGAAALPYFGFNENASALGLSEGIFFSYGGPTTGDLVLGDPQFRRLIRARILKNISGGRVEDMIKYCDLLTGKEYDLEIDTSKVSSAHLRFHATLPVEDKLLLSLRVAHIAPVGVEVTMEDDAGSIEVIYDPKTSL